MAVACIFEWPAFFLPDCCCCVDLSNVKEVDLSMELHVVNPFA